MREGEGVKLMNNGSQIMVGDSVELLFLCNMQGDLGVSPGQSSCCCSTKRSKQMLAPLQRGQSPA